MSRTGWVPARSAEGLVPIGRARKSSIAVRACRAVEIVLVRHGETEWSRDWRHTGRTDIPLTEAGREQAEVLRAPLSDWSFARIYSSPLSRALETCRLAGLGDGAELTEALLEWDYGEYEGITTKQIRETRPGWFLWRDGCPGGETADEVGARVDPLIAELKRVDGDVALFAHGHILRVLAARWLGLPPQDGKLLALSTATLSVLGYERETAVIRRWNAPVTASPDASTTSRPAAS
jgi:broad specificity phosphatase PhoE